MRVSKKTEKLKRIKNEIISLEESPLYAYRTKNNYFPVIGEGNHDADLMLIGEAPGKNEAETGRPFCGRAGKILDELLRNAGIDREDIYITNVIKDRPPKNRDPLPEEIDVYASFLDRQIEIIEPSLIVTLGRFASNYILQKYGFGEKFAISKINGKIYKKEGLNLKIIPVFHPAASIYSPERKKDLVTGFNKISRLLNK